MKREWVVTQDENILWTVVTLQAQLHQIIEDLNTIETDSGSVAHFQLESTS